MTLSSAEQQELENLRVEFDVLGGRSVELANRIDELEDKAKTVFERTVEEYGENIHGHCRLEDLDLDPNAKYLLVQSNVRGGYWLASFDDKDDAYGYHINDEYAEDWIWECLVDLETGHKFHPKTVTVTSWVEYGADGKLVSK